VDITGEYYITATREQVWEALNDPQVLKQVIPGCKSLEKTSDTQIQVEVVNKIGPMKATFKTQLELTNLNPPSSYTLVGEGKGGAAGFGRGSADVSLEENGNVTVLRYKADFKVGGKLAQVGSRLVLAATRKIADDFFSSFSTYLDPGAEKVQTEDEAPVRQTGKGTKTLWLTAAVVIVAILLVLWLL
jgi:carbon monoxide dehydrogenase subunit G